MLKPLGVNIGQTEDHFPTRPYSQIDMLGLRYRFVTFEGNAVNFRSDGVPVHYPLDGAAGTFHGRGRRPDVGGLDQAYRGTSPIRKRPPP